MATQPAAERTCIASVVYGTYGRFIPFYIYSVQRSYPDYFVKVYVQGSLTAGERRAVGRLRNSGLTNFEIVENYRTDLRWGVALRWLLPSSEFDGFDNLFIGDIDFLIVRENPALAQGHLAHCARRGLPYSNEVRPGSQRLTGTQFMVVQPYFEKVDPLIEPYMRDTNLLVTYAQQHRDNDEWFLYELASRAFGTPEESAPKDYYRPTHGFHLGHTRKRDLKRLDWYISEIFPDATAGATLEEAADQIRGFFDDPLFVRMLADVPEPGILMVPQALGIRPRSPRVRLLLRYAGLKRALLDLPGRIHRAVHLYATRAVDAIKRLIVRILRMLKLKPPAPESERDSKRS